MVDNTRLNVGKGGNLIASDEVTISGTPVHLQRVKIQFGPEGTTYGDVDYELPFPTLPSSHMYSKGTVTNHESLRKFGLNAAVGTTEGFIEINDGAGPYMPTSATTIEVISSDTSDDVGGNGALTIDVYGLNASFARINETLTLNGTSASTASTNSFIRVYRAEVATVGAYGSSNVGNLTVRASGGGTTFLTVAAGRGQSQTSHYCVAAGHKLFIKDVHITTETAKSTSVRFWKRETADDVTTPFSPKRIVQEYIGLSESVDFEYTPELYIPEKTDIWATGVVSAATGAVSVEYNCILETA